MGIIDIVTRKGEPFGKLTAYPVLLKDYELFEANKLSLILMQKKFGAEMIGMPYLRFIAFLSNEEIDLMGMLFKILSIVFHIDEKQIRLNIDETQGRISLSIMESVDSPNVLETISELRFNKLRELIAAQNNIELPNEKANLEILESEEALLRLNTPRLKVDFQSLFFSVATYCGFTTETMLNMTIFEFEERVSAISRIIKYEMYGQGEISGFAQFKGGNPFPAWCYDREKDGLHGTIPYEQFEKRVGNVIAQS